MLFRPKSSRLSKDGSKFRSGIELFRESMHSTRAGLVHATMCSLLAAGVLVLYFAGSLIYGSKDAAVVLPARHGHYVHSIQSPTPLIFPRVEDTHVLRDMGLRTLYILRIDEHQRSRISMEVGDRPTPEKNLPKDDKRALAKRSFLDHGKRVYHRTSNHPEVVLVTLIDFENYDKNTITRIVQNRVDYAAKRGYGIYVRWAQEFIPLVDKQTLEDSYEFMKPMAMRAAMHAFPHAKYFWFLDHTGLIMNMDFSLQDNLLASRSLNNVLLRDVPVVAGTTIKTYSNFAPANAKILVPQSPLGELDTNSFIVSSTLYGKAFLDYLSDPLIRNYNWDSLAASIGHMLQWHPKFLSKTGLVKSKVIAARYIPNRSPDSPNAAEVAYEDGDAVVLFTGCDERQSCPADIEKFSTKKSS
ncbi:FAEL142Wp [Eremothecium gossypii FDAG1]|nr:FAEL142Wp [Eremothecium gossypii FDAG1]